MKRIITICFVVALGCSLLQTACSVHSQNRTGNEASEKDKRQNDTSSSTVVASTSDEEGHATGTEASDTAVAKAESENEDLDASDEDDDLMDEFLQHLEDEIVTSIEDEGTLPVEDPDGHPRKLKGDLEFVEVLDHEAVEYEEHTFFAPVLVTGTTEDGEEMEYDLDAFMSYDEDEESWTMERLLLHKINRKAEFTYLNNNPTSHEYLTREDFRETTDHPLEYGEDREGDREE